MFFRSLIHDFVFSSDLMLSQSHLMQNRTKQSQCQMETPFICNEKIIQITRANENTREKQVTLIRGVKSVKKRRTSRSNLSSVDIRPIASKIARLDDYAN